jgi:hypothetical protein
MWCKESHFIGVVIRGGVLHSNDFGGAPKARSSSFLLSSLLLSPQSQRGWIVKPPVVAGWIGEVARLGAFIA